MSDFVADEPGSALPPDLQRAIPMGEPLQMRLSSDSDVSEPPQTSPSTTRTEADTDVGQFTSTEPMEGLGEAIRVGKTLHLNIYRYRLTMLLIAIVALLAAGAVCGSIFVFDDDARFGNFREILLIVFGPLVTLLSTSFAWFFARRDAS